ncbi:MAG: hypothetical protein HKO92_02290 [Flavobacteriaceae bacterium]|nr:hypothetical protein [Bacteroidia bacterium]NNK81932.1 hypothetical protein [Flavobacteriaceae bacterium]
MKKDIIIPKVKDVYIAVVNQYNDIYKTYDWNAYIINDKDVALEMVLIVSRGYDENRVTSTMRHKLEQLPAKSYAKIELVQEDVLELNNEFIVTFFENNKMYDKTFLFRKNTINKNALQPIPLMDTKGVLVK